MLAPASKANTGSRSQAAFTIASQLLLCLVHASRHTQKRNTASSILPPRSPLTTQPPTHLHAAIAFLTGTIYQANTAHLSVHTHKQTHSTRTNANTHAFTQIHLAHSINTPTPTHLAHVQPPTCTPATPFQLLCAWTTQPIHTLTSTHTQTLSTQHQQPHTPYSQSTTYLHAAIAFPAASVSGQHSPSTALPTTSWARPPSTTSSRRPTCTSW